MTSMFYHYIVAFSVSCIKFLLIPSYFSTDLEVHRNWMAITANKPLSQWYNEATSQWTLDYPPLFAWFELGLTLVAPYFDPKMLQLSEEAYVSYGTILFLRLTVIFTDLLLIYAVNEWCKIVSREKKLKCVLDEFYNPVMVISFLFLWNPALLIVDHIHFQYNGLLNGIFLLSMVRVFEGRLTESAFFFSILLNMKHIYLYVAPVYFFYLLKLYCLDGKNRLIFHNLAKLSAVVLGVFVFSFGPFIAMGKLNQVLARLFPFKRGLTHAYWAPNFWALYNAFDLGLSILLNGKSNSPFTSGLVQESSHKVLPSVGPLTTFFLTVASIIPILIELWRNVSREKCASANGLIFFNAITVCAFCSFLFGYHVHEKAILMVILPLTPLALISHGKANIFAILSTVGCFSVFPLLFKEGETLTKICLLLLYCIYSINALRTIHGKRLFQPFEKIYLLGLVLLQLFYSFGSLALPFTAKFEFLPLLLISTYCGVGISWCFLKLYYQNLDNNLIGV